MDIGGKVPNKLLRRAQFRDQHFDDDLNFLQRDIDKVSNKVSAKLARSSRLAIV
jgi:serine/threonine-protein kinase PRP4